MTMPPGPATSAPQRADASELNEPIVPMTGPGTQPPAVRALFAPAAADPQAARVLLALQRLVDRGLARWSVDECGGVQFVVLHGAAFEVTLTHLTRIR